MSRWAGLSALDFDISDHVHEYRKKRDMMLAELQDDFEIYGANGAFYLFIKSPWGSATEFTARAIEQNLLIIPGNVFSSRDTHFRLSYAADNETLQRGAEVLLQLARRGM